MAGACVSVIRVRADVSPFVLVAIRVEPCWLLLPFGAGYTLPRYPAADWNRVRELIAELIGFGVITDDLGYRNRVSAT